MQALAARAIDMATDVFFIHYIGLCTYEANVAEWGMIAQPFPPSLIILRTVSVT
ncbi:hypothetical protein [Shewanella fidelis]|uniref:Uncharacterized protein n=1 Tax=Shewanella fidelis TaxID=173509 RepID=A0AAW8NKF5_9GAMM|nr:hypothetical protein [Shewanella fidelis]MDR8522875.1 hypothetical protein [Shewanella fidelis]MDW4811799.1 hypothetical protein [Shewanella fidelis]MDW4815920.1 hypothetical protein [Shewanella fidelis]MDW4820010.1 hypothetical protein [Shewanella fidelis]MDW4824016.1 hypothetical protein [Shewanella fidelis]